VALTLAKLAVGLWTNSLGILSEAAHSGLDLVAAVVTWLTVRVSGKPADRRHPYGHGKFENLSALFETLLLLGTCVWIVKEALSRLFIKDKPVEVNVWSFLVIALSIAVNYSRAAALRRVARKHGSQALEADALHFTSDIWSSYVVIAGLAAVWIAHRWGLGWLAEADPVAALGVAAIVIFACWELGKRAVGDLLDEVPEGLAEDVGTAAKVAGVMEVRQVRVRRSGPEYFADVTLAVGHEAAFEAAHDVAHRAETAIKALLPAADVVIHVEPLAPVEEGLLTKTRLLAARHGLGAHGIRVYEEAGSRSLELHLEVDETLRLSEAHRKADEFEKALR